MHDHGREIAVGGDDPIGIRRVGVEQFQRLDHHLHVRGILALAVVELLDGADRIFVQDLFPPLQRLLLPVAIGPADVADPHLGQFGEDDVDLRGWRVVGIDEQRNAGLVFEHGIRSVSEYRQRTCAMA